MLFPVVDVILYTYESSKRSDEMNETTVTRLLNGCNLYQVSE